MWGVGTAEHFAVCCSSHVLPVVAVQISPRDPAPELEERLLSACSTGLRARCVAARAQQLQPAHAVAVVSWTSPTHVQIEVGLSGGTEPLWVSRELDFSADDPEIERWRGIGFTIAVLADDERLWTEQREAAPAAAAAPVQTLAASGAGAEPSLQDASPTQVERLPLQLDLRALGGAGLVGDALRLGAEARGWVALSEVFGLTGSLSYSAASAEALELRWLDVSLGLGVSSPRLWRDIGARLRLEALLENVSALAERDNVSDRRSAWVPGVVLGSDLLWHVNDRWLLSARVDGFWLDGATAIRSGEQLLGTSAGAGVLLGLGAGFRF